MEDTYHPLPQPEELATREREDAMGAYLMMFAALGAGLPLPIINLLASIIYFYINKSKSRFVKFHTLQALLSQVPTTLMNAAGIFWGLRIAFSESWYLTDAFKGYVVAIIVANVLYLIFCIIAAIKARKGQFYYLWFFGKIAYQNVFKITPELAENKIVNTPPKF